MSQEDTNDIDAQAIMECISELAQIMDKYFAKDSRTAYASLLYFFVQTSCAVGMSKERTIQVVEQALKVKEIADAADAMIVMGEGDSKWLN